MVGAEHKRSTGIASATAAGVPDLPDLAPAPGVSAATLRRVERAAGALATRSVALMDEKLPWFRSLPANQRSWVSLVAHAGISGYVTWAHGGGTDFRATDQVFGTAPRDLTRAVSLRRTVELVRIAITVAEEHLPGLAADEKESAALRDSLLRYSREIAFAAAAVYAAAAETRGAWDARVEAALVDGIVRGEEAQTVASRAAALDWDTAAEARVVVGTAPPGDRAQAVAGVADWAHAGGYTAIAGVHGTRLVVVIAGTSEPGPGVANVFAPGPVVRGPAGPGLVGAHRSAVEALSGLAVAAAWPDAPRPIASADLLPERVVAGDVAAADHLRATVFAPLAAASAPLLKTLDAYLAHGGALEPAARSLFVHPNTMRYRLRRVAEITGRDPWDPRDLLAVHLALMLGRLSSQ